MVEQRFAFESRMINFFTWILNSDEWDILILITRKGYWIYKIAVPYDLQREAKKKGKKIYSDRYILKCLDMEQFAGKRVWIYDDAMTNGVTMFFYYSYLTKNGAKVTPIVFGLSTEYPSENSKRQLVREYERVCRGEEMSDEEQRVKAELEIERFNQVLRWELRMPSKQIGLLCTQEVQYFQDKLCPMVVDLPILSCEADVDGARGEPAYINQGDGRGILIEPSLFEKLKENNSEWKYIDNRVKTETLDVNCSYFRYSSDILSAEFPGILHDGIVKCKAVTTGEKVSLVFAPFAILKSMTFCDVAACFFGMFRDTEYGDTVYRHIFKNEQEDGDWMKNVQTVIQRMKEDHNLCRNMYRGIIFYISNVLGQNFSEYFYKTTGISLDYDWRIMDESFPPDFIHTFQRQYREPLNCLKCAFGSEFTKVAPIGVAEAGSRKIAADRGEAELFILNRLIGKKRKEDKKLRDRIYTLEAIEAEFEENFAFQSQAQKKELITDTILAFLDTSRFGNEIYVDNEEEIIYRGFRHGENSELLFLKGMSYVSAFVQAFYDELTTKQPDETKVSELYYEYYPDFSENMELYFKKEGLFNYLVRVDVFDFLRKYYREIPGERINEAITGKQVIWDNAEKTPGMDYFKEQAFTMISQWE